jgi:Winged helix-turn helix
MPRRSPYRLVLDDETRRVLEGRARRYTLPYREVVRAQLVLLAAEGVDNDEIAARLNTRREVVSKWRKRFAGLEERPRRGRPVRFPPSLAVEVKAIACELPALLGLPLARLHVPDIAGRGAPPRPGGRDQ